jgi:cytochrome c oxidase cbb3-type subunit I/II
MLSLKERQCHCSLYRLGNCPRTRWRPGVERISRIWYDILVTSSAKLFKTRLHSHVGLANLHFWIGTLRNHVLYALPMYVAGFTQASMWKQFNPDGTLVYGNFLETVIRDHTHVLDARHRRNAVHYRYAGTWSIILLMTIVQSRVAKVEDELAEAPALSTSFNRQA